MNERTLHVLEYDKIIALLKKETATSIGRTKAAALYPVTSRDDVERLQEETDEAMAVLRLNKTIPFSHITDITDSLKRSKIGSTLDAMECTQIAQVIYSGRQMKNFVLQLEEVEIPLLQELAEDILPFRELEAAITSKIDEQGNVLDHASPALRGIRQSIRAYEASIRERLQHITRTKSKMLSDAIVTIRNDRYVLPVKQEYKGAIGGIVHDQSSSGQTLFMEPKAIIELNNQLQHGVVKERQEIDIILQKLTAVIADHADGLADNLDYIAETDFIAARARLAVTMKASRPLLNTDGLIDVKAVRHPLLPFDTAVASDIRLGEDYHAIVITGPNTGGKTVTLKTIGLCTVMAQSGLQIPAMDGGKLACFDKIFADIGDEQSIEQNLSTFSSHMTNIVQIMEEVDHQTLVLFDELGAGTDPQEGAALAMSILDDVLERKATVVATTHYPELKAYGYNREGVINASVEFDVESLRPTYRLLMGVPGRSNAFEISDRLGLDAAIIQHAKAYIGVDSKNVEQMIQALEDTKKAAEKEFDEAAQYVVDAETVKHHLETEWRKFEQERDRLYQQAEEKAEKALQKARDEAEMIVQEVRQMRDKSLWKEHEWIEAKKMLDEAQPQLVRGQKANEQKNQTEQSFDVGDEIQHTTLGQTGEIVEKKNEKEYVIQVGKMRMTAKRQDLKFVKKKADMNKQAPVSHMLTTASASSVKPELDLRGERYEDAMIRLEKYIDDALIQSYPRVTIIHGKGTGALRKGVEKLIRKTPAIKSHRPGEQSEGGSGVTVLELQ